MSITPEQFLNLATKDDLKILEDKFSHLPTKEEFFAEMDKLSRKLDIHTTERVALSHRVNTLESDVGLIKNHINFK